MDSLRRYIQQKLPVSHKRTGLTNVSVSSSTVVSKSLSRWWAQVEFAVVATVFAQLIETAAQQTCPEITGGFLNTRDSPECDWKLPFLKHCSSVKLRAPAYSRASCRKRGSEISLSPIGAFERPQEWQSVQWTLSELPLYINGRLRRVPAVAAADCNVDTSPMHQAFALRYMTYDVLCIHSNHTVSNLFPLGK